MTEEQYLQQQLIELHRSYQIQAEPLVKRLAAIKSLKPPQEFFATPVAAAKREPLSDEDVSIAAHRSNCIRTDFTIGVRFAERAHGIEGEA